MMGEAARKEYTPEFKREAVALVLEQGYTQVEAARNFGINRDMLRRWKREVKQEAGLAPQFDVATKVIEILTVVARGEIQMLIHWVREKKNS
jgi:transposase-like protein